MKKSFLGLGIIVFGIIVSLFILAKTPKQKTTENLYEASFLSK